MNLPFRWKHAPPPPFERHPVSQPYNLDALLGGKREEKEEQLPNGEWRCDYCDHVNKPEMLDCHYCGAKKPKQHTQDCPSFPLHYNVSARLIPY